MNSQPNKKEIYIIKKLLFAKEVEKVLMGCELLLAFLESTHDFLSIFSTFGYRYHHHILQPQFYSLYQTSLHCCFKHVEGADDIGLYEVCGAVN